MNRGSAIVAVIVLGSFGWAYLEFQKSDAAFAKVKAFCAEIRPGDSLDVVEAKAKSESLGAKAGFSSSEPNTKRDHFTATGISIGKFREEARCIVDHVERKVVRVKTEIRDTTSESTDPR